MTDLPFFSSLQRHDCICTSSRTEHELMRVILLQAISVGDRERANTFLCDQLEERFLERRLTRRGWLVEQQQPRLGHAVLCTTPHLEARAAEALLLAAREGLGARGTEERGRVGGEVAQTRPAERIDEYCVGEGPEGSGELVACALGWGGR